MLLTAEEMMDRLGVSKPIFYKLKREGMPEVRISPKLIRYDPEDVVKWLKERNDRMKQEKTG